MVITHGQRWKIGNLSHLVKAKKRTCQILVKYVKIAHFYGIMALPEVQKGVEICQKLANFVEFCQ